MDKDYLDPITLQWHSRVSLREIRTLASSSRSPDRYEATQIMRRQAADLIKGYLPLARKLLHDSDNDIRWQSAIVVGEYIEQMPQEVMRVVVKNATHHDADMNTALATVLLEHLLEHQAETTISEIEVILKDRPTHPIRDVLSRIWYFGQAEKHRERIESLAEC